MNPSNSKPKLNRQIYEEAAEWLVELRVGDVDAGTRERLDTWFRESPHHIRAFLELSSIWEDGGDPDLDRAHSTDDLIGKARATCNVVPLGLGSAGPAEGGGRGGAPTVMRPGRAIVSRRFHRRAVVAASLVSACLLGLLGYWFQNRMERTYTTSVGEERSIALPDGSTLELNSRSRLRIRFSERERDIELLEGQALFKVVKDPARPFVVQSGSARVRAVGTQFDVYRKASGTTVTVVEGRVAVLPAQGVGPDASPPPTATPDALARGTHDAIILFAGEQVTVAPSATAKPRKADVATATAWTQHQLVFESTPLTDVAQEFNRYNLRQLVVDDAGLQNFHVTGVFSSTDPASLLRFLRAQRGISVEDSDMQIRISRR